MQPLEGLGLDLSHQMHLIKINYFREFFLILLRVSGDNPR